MKTVEALESEKRTGSALRLLIVEDDPDIGEGLATMLDERFENWEVHLAESLGQGLQILDHQLFDAVIVDLGLPDTQGSEAPRQIRDRHPDLPIVVLTGQSSDVLARALIQAGVQDFIVKGEVSHDQIAITVLNARERTLQLRDLKQAAERDALTGALNRRSFEQAFEREMQRARDLGRSFGLAFLDLDNFKSINDTHGHGFGDRTLQMFVDWLASESRPSDRIYRMGGDEFAVLITDLPTPDGLDAYRERLAQRTACAFQLSGADIAFGVSIGTAVYPEDGVTAEDLRQAADRRMYDMKRARSALPGIEV